MKKYKLFLICLIVLMIIPIILKTIEKKHKSNYKINDYNIKESFYIKDKNHNYDIVISNKNQKYSYTITENLNKRKKIIKSIKTYKSNNITCIIPNYKKNIDSRIYCLKDDKQVSNYYLEDNQDYKKILKKIKNNNLVLPSNSDNKTNYKKINIYQKNILKDNLYILWNYKGINIISNNSIKNQKILNYDLYDNIMSTVTSRYYVLFENTNVMGIENIHYYDLKKDKYNTFKLENKISKNSYINGVYNDLIYITDIDKKIEYTLNVKKKKLEIIGQDEEFIKYSNNKKEVLNKSDFFMKKQFFNNEIISNSIIEDNYKYFIKNNKVYKKLENENNILLFELDNIKKWYTYNKDLILISEDTLYFYNDDTGLRKIIEYNELKYNNEDLIQFWK